MNLEVGLVWKPSCDRACLCDGYALYSIILGTLMRSAFAGLVYPPCACFLLLVVYSVLGRCASASPEAAGMAVPVP